MTHHSSDDNPQPATPYSYDPAQIPAPMPEIGYTPYAYADSQTPKQADYLAPPNANSYRYGAIRFRDFSLGRRLVVGGGLGVFIAMFLPWLSFSTGFGVALSVNGFQTNPIIVVLLGIIMAAMLLPLAGRYFSQIFKRSFLRDGLIALWGSGFTFVMTGLRMVGSLEYVGIGFWIACLAMMVMVWGGWLMVKNRE